MQSILKYICFSLLLIFLTQTTHSQDKRVVGPRLGFDVGNLVREYFEPGYTEYAFSLDYEIDLKYYPVLEFGKFDIEKDEDKLNYQSEGYFGKVGVDYNVVDLKGPWDHDILFAGLRFGYSNYQHEASDILIRDNYWGDHNIDQISQSDLNAWWVSAVMGIRVEVIKNVFMGWSLRGKLMLFQDNDNTMTPYMIPGYGKGGSNTALGVRYYIFYRIPLTKRNY